MDPGSLRAGVLSWFRLCLGLGIFSIPFCISNMGMLFGTIFLSLATLSSYINYKIIFKSSFLWKSDDYFIIVKKVLGKSYYKLFKISLLIDLCSNYIVFPILSWKIFVYVTTKLDLIEYNFIDKENIWINEYEKKNFIIRIIFLFSGFLLSLYFLLLKKLENMKILSFIFILLLIYFFILIFIEGIYNIKLDFININFNNLFYKKFELKFFIYMSNLILSFYTQPFILDIKKEVFHPTNKRVKKIYKNTTIFIFFLYCALGLLGTVGYHEDLNDIIILSHHNKVFQKFFFYPICLFLILLILTTPIYNPSLRNFINILYKIKDTKKNFILVSIIPYLISILIAIAYPNIIEIFGIIGGVIYNFNGFITPLLIELKLVYKNDGNRRKLIFYFMMILLHMFNLVGTVFTILYYDIFKI